MKSKHSSFFFLLMALILTLPAAAQDMTVRSMVHTPLDQTANITENMVKDNNGEVCGIVKRLFSLSATKKLRPHLSR